MQIFLPYPDNEFDTIALQDGRLPVGFPFWATIIPFLIVMTGQQQSSRP